MAMNGTGVPRDRWRQLRLAEKREARGLSRKGKVYRGWDAFNSAHAPVRNPTYKGKLRGKFKGRRTIDVPTKLDCTTAEDWSALAELLDTIRTAALRSRFRRVVLNFHEVESLAPEAAVALVAEIQRCRAFCNERTEITGTYPASHDVAALLCDVGFFKALGVKEPVRPKQYAPRTYVQIERRNSSTPETADDLLDCFSEVFDFDPPDRKRLYVALVESMDNVYEHAYPPASTAAHFMREWWLLGYADRVHNTVGFTFYDQGAGIPATIRNRQNDRVRSRLRGWSDGDWISRAVSKGVSRHKSKRRGHGLHNLKEFIGRLDPEIDGSLQVLANCGLVTFTSKGNKDVSKITKELYGTLVVWKLRGFEVNVPAASDGEQADAA